MVIVLGMAIVAASLGLPGKMQAGAFTAVPEPMATVAEVDRSANPLTQQEPPPILVIASAETSNSAGAAAAGFRLSASQQQQMLISGHGGAGMAASFAGGSSVRRQAVASQGSGFGGGSGSGGSSGSRVPTTGGTISPAIGPTSPENGAASAAIGADAAHPVLPSATINGSYVFDHSATSAGTPVFFDPPVASGYIFTSSGPNFATFTVTTPLPNTSALTFTFNGTSTSVNATSPGSGQFPEFAFPSGGVSQFTLSGINANDIHGQEFTYAFTFADSGPISFSQTPLAFPEPGSLTLLSVGVAGLLVWRRRGKALPMALER
jgi:hypothetical protein